MVAVIGGIAYVVRVPANKQDEVARALYDLSDTSIALGENAAKNAVALNLFIGGQIGSDINIHVSPIGTVKPGTGVLINPIQDNPFAGIPGLEIQNFDSVLKNLGKPIDNNGVTVLVKPLHAKNPNDYVIYNSGFEFKASPNIPQAGTPSAVQSAVKDKWGYTLNQSDRNEIANTINRIERNDKSAYPRDDGETFENDPTRGKPGDKRLDSGENYTEWTVKDPKYLTKRAERRIVIGDRTGRAYYTHDHYGNWIEIDIRKW